MSERTAVYPGTFDPITYGHIDVIDQAASLFPRVIVLVARNTSKAPLFSDEERINMIRDVVKDRDGVSVDGFDGLLADYAVKNKISVIVRGLRAVSDFEYEFQMAQTNRKLAGDIDTVFLVPHEQFTYLNSTIVREVARFGGDVSEFVPPSVRSMLVKKMAGNRP
jgi:pantetheine-phosphate adenylyltransferase